MSENESIPRLALSEAKTGIKTEAVATLEVSSGRKFIATRKIRMSKGGVPSRKRKAIGQPGGESCSLKSCCQTQSAAKQDQDAPGELFHIRPLQNAPLRSVNVQNEEDIARPGRSPDQRARAEGLAAAGFDRSKGQLRQKIPAALSILARSEDRVHRVSVERSS